MLLLSTLSLFLDLRGSTACYDEALFTLRHIRTVPDGVLHNNVQADDDISAEAGGVDLLSGQLP
jgi:hypothetical protein